MSSDVTPPAGDQRASNLVPPLALETRPLGALRPAPRRVRRAEKAQVRRIRSSIERFGCIRPLLIAGDGEIVDGHATVEALRALGAAAAPCIIIDHLTKVQIRQLRLALNRIQERGSWDETALKLEFENLIEIHADFEIPGFELPEIDAIVKVGDAGDTPDPADALDAALGVGGPVVTAPGDLWTLGEHRLLCASARDADAMARLIGDRSVAMVFTDPPYNVPVNGHVRTGRAGRFAEFAEASGEMSSEEFTDFLAEALDRAAAALAPGGLLYACIDWRHMRELQDALARLRLWIINVCVWVKPSGGMGSLYRSRHELVFVAAKPGAPRRNNVQLGRFGRDRTNVWEYAGATGGARARGDDDFACHPTVKPIRLVADAVLDASALGETVLDPFLGSGATLLAAERVRRRCLGVEIDPGYVDLAIRRWRAITGRDAVHAESGETFAAREARAGDKSARETADDGPPTPRGAPRTGRPDAGRAAE